MSDLHDDSVASSFDDASEPFASYASSSARLAAHTRDDRAVFDLTAFASWLPKLGAVLWIDRGTSRRGARAIVGSHGLLMLDHPALHALATSSSMTAHTQLTSQGPREWLACHDAGGETIAKLFLLPDTDYLAWDEMIASLQLQIRVEEPRRGCPHVALLRNTLARASARWRARLLTFEHRRLPWLHTLDARAPLRLSLLGHELARAIVHGEGAELPSPLHAI